MKKKMFTLWMTGVFLLLTTLGATAQNSGTIPGSTLSWQYDDATHTPSITGTGAMPDFINSKTDRPWHFFQSEIRTATIGDGVTTIGENTFHGCTALTDVTVAWVDTASIPNLPAYVFQGVTLANVKLHRHDGGLSIGSPSGKTSRS